MGALKQKYKMLRKEQETPGTTAKCTHAATKQTFIWSFVSN